MEHPYDEQQTRLLLRISNSVAQLADVVDSLNEELEAVDSAGNDVGCVTEILCRYRNKISV